MLGAMRMITPAVFLAIAALWTVTAHAAPGNSGDDMDRLLADKGLLTQIDQVRQNVSHKASELVVNAMGFLGVPYKRGGNNVETGFDCSGFVRSIYFRDPNGYVIELTAKAPHHAAGFPSRVR